MNGTMEWINDIIKSPIFQKRPAKNRVCDWVIFNESNSWVLWHFQIKETVVSFHPSNFFMFNWLASTSLMNRQSWNQLAYDRIEEKRYNDCKCESKWNESFCIKIFYRNHANSECVSLSDEPFFWLTFHEMWFLAKNSSNFSEIPTRDLKTIDHHSKRWSSNLWWITSLVNYIKWISPKSNSDICQIVTSHSFEMPT